VAGSSIEQLIGQTDLVEVYTHEALFACSTTMILMEGSRKSKNSTVASSAIAERDPQARLHRHR
jgi:hypothetical protein